MQLHNIALGKLIAEAGGDPWAIDDSVQRGRPAQISALAQAFHNSGLCTAESSDAFAEARRRFDAAWNRDNGEDPINDSAEVRRATRALVLQAEQLPVIAVDLENVAANLAETQRSCGTLISTLKNQLRQIDNDLGQALQLERSGHLSAHDLKQLDQHITDLEHSAINATKNAFYQLLSIRNNYSDSLEKSKVSLRTDGYDPAAIEELNGEKTKGQQPADIPPSGLEAIELADIQRVTNQAVVDQMAKVRAAQKALDDALATSYTKGQGSPEGQAAIERLPQLKHNLADTLDELGNLPDYNNIDPSAVRAGPDGHFLFGYAADGQPVQVTGQLKNGTGELFDQRTHTSYTFKNGKLVETRNLDPGHIDATAEPLLTAVTLAAGAPELKATGEAAWQGIKALLTRETLASGADITSENVLPRALAAAETRAESAAQNLAAPGSLPPASAADHPPPLTTAQHPVPPAPADHPAPSTTHDVASAGTGAHAPPPVAEAPHPLAPGPDFTCDNPLDQMSPELRALSEQHLSGSGETVLGPYSPADGGPSYIEVAQQHEASYFDIGDAWNAATPAERLAANQHVLDIAIANRDTITLSVPARMIPEDSYTAAEIRYLEAHGYQLRGPSTLAPPA